MANLKDSSLRRLLFSINSCTNKDLRIKTILQNEDIKLFPIEKVNRTLTKEEKTELNIDFNQIKSLHDKSTKALESLPNHRMLPIFKRLNELIRSHISKVLYTYLIKRSIAQKFFGPKMKLTRLDQYLDSVQEFDKTPECLRLISQGMSEPEVTEIISATKPSKKGFTINEDRLSKKEYPKDILDTIKEIDNTTKHFVLKDSGYNRTVHVTPFKEDISEAFQGFIDSEIQNHHKKEENEDSSNYDLKDQEKEEEINTSKVK